MKALPVGNRKHKSESVGLGGGQKLYYHMGQTDAQNNSRYTEITQCPKSGIPKGLAASLTCVTGAGLWGVPAVVGWWALLIAVGWEGLAVLLQTL